MCAEAPNRGGLSAGLLARDFDTTVFPGAVSFCEGNPIAGPMNLKGPELEGP